MHSFDIFDTCLVRPWATGLDLLAEAARAVAAPDAPDELIGEAVRLRLLGEVRSCGDGRDASPLDVVYAAVPELSHLGIEPTAMLASELRLERDGLRPVAATAAEIARLRASGSRILFVSDMHLPTALLRDRLLEFGLARPGDPVHVSGDIGLSNRTGRLFEHMLRLEGLPAGQLVHHGDDEDTDVRRAAALGIAVQPFAQGRLNRYEQQVLTSAATTVALRRRTAGISRLARLGEADTGSTAVQAATLGADVVGPLLTGFVRWVIDDARRRGIQTLCFVSRDGQVLHEIAQRVRRPEDPACLYVYGSRQAWFGATVRSAEVEHLSWIFEPRHEQATVRSLLAKLSVTPDEVAAELAALGLGHDDVVAHDQFDVFAELLPHIAPVVEERGAQARAALEGYFAQEGLLDGRPWGLVDVGWYLNAQVALRSALGADLPVHGYYLALHAERRPMAEAGDFRTAVREDAPGLRHLLPGGWLLESANIVEHVFVKADHGQCVGYERREGRWQPRLRPLRPLPDWYAPMRAAVLRFTDAAVSAGLTDDAGAALFAAGDVAGALFLRRPDRGAALLFGGTLVSDDLNESGLRPLAPPLGVEQVRWRIEQRLGIGADDPRRWRHWEAGSLAASPPAVRLAIAAGRSAVPVVRRAAAVVRTRLVALRSR